MKLLSNLSIGLVLAIAIYPGDVFAADNKQDLPESVGELVLDKDAKVDIAYVKPGVTWGNFSSLYIRELQITDEAKDATPNGKHSSPSSIRESWLIPEKDVAKMKSEFMRVFREELEKRDQTIVSEPTEGTLIVAPIIVDIYLAAPIEDSRRTYKSQGAVYTQGGGSMTLGAVFADGKDYKVIAEVVDSRYASNTWGRNSRVTNLSDMRQIFRSWAKQLGKSLQKAQKKAEQKGG